MKLKQLCEEEKEKVKGQTRSLEVEKHDLLCRKKTISQESYKYYLKENNVDKNLHYREEGN